MLSSATHLPHPVHPQTPAPPPPRSFSLLTPHRAYATSATDMLPSAHSTCTSARRCPDGPGISRCSTPCRAATPPDATNHSA
eukprot:349627-Chlamydomonas_euryale.AAC.9